MSQFELDAEQRKIVEFKKPGFISVRGVPGSGKTLIGIERLSRQLKKASSEENVILFTYHQVHTKYLNELIEEKTANSNLFSSVIQKEAKTLQSIIKINYEKFKTNHWPEYNVNDSKFFQNLIKDIINDPELNFSHTIKNIKPYDLEKVINLIIEFNFQETPALNILLQATINPNKNQYLEAIDFNELKKLSEQFINYSLKKGKISFSVMKYLTFYKMKKNTKFIKKYKHIIVDECQDLSRLEFDIIDILYENSRESSISVLYDDSQSIYEKSWLGNNHDFGCFNFSKSKKEFELVKNYRTADEILKASKHLINNVSKKLKRKFLTPTYVNKVTITPTWYQFNSQEYVQKRVAELCDYHTNGKNGNILILSRTNKEIEHISNYLNSLNIHHEKCNQKNYSNNSIKLMTIHSSKGIQADVVIILNINKENFDKYSFSNERLLYVAMTRAQRYLYFISTDEESSYLRSIRNFVNKETNYIPLEITQKQEGALKKIIDHFHNKLQYFENEAKKVKDVKDVSSFRNKFKSLLNDDDLYIEVGLQPEELNLLIDGSLFKDFLLDFSNKSDEIYTKHAERIDQTKNTLLVKNNKKKEKKHLTIRELHEQKKKFENIIKTLENEIAKKNKSLQNPDKLWQEQLDLYISNEMKNFKKSYQYIPDFYLREFIIVRRMSQGKSQIDYFHMAARAYRIIEFIQEKELSVVYKRYGCSLRELNESEIEPELKNLKITLDNNDKLRRLRNDIVHNKFNFTETEIKELKNNINTIHHFIFKELNKYLKHEMTDIKVVLN